VRRCRRSHEADAKNPMPLHASPWLGASVGWADDPRIRSTDDAHT
jgi:hypothetical protein